MSVKIREDIVPGFWYMSNNFGDAITHYLLGKLSGKTPVWVDPNEYINKYVVTGSILNNVIKCATVWGAGIANKEDIIPVEHTVLAVRGVNTLNRLAECRAEQEAEFVEGEIAVGDPTLLMPRLYMSEQTSKYVVGIIPHYVDAIHLAHRMVDVKLYEQYGVRFIDVNQPVESFIDEVVSCQYIVSSSLHGIICADAYGIPADRGVLTNGIGGDGFKYSDWCSNFFGREDRFINLNDIPWHNPKEAVTELEQLHSKVVWKASIKIDLGHLARTCPFDNLGLLK